MASAEKHYGAAVALLRRAEEVDAEYAVSLRAHAQVEALLYVGSVLYDLHSVGQELVNVGSAALSMAERGK